MLTNREAEDRIIDRLLADALAQGYAISVIEMKGMTREAYDSIRSLLGFEPLEEVRS